MNRSELLTEKQRPWQQHALPTKSYSGSLADYAKQQQQMEQLLEQFRLHCIGSLGANSEQPPGQRRLFNEVEIFAA